MVEQPVPEVTEDDVKRIALRDFGDSGIGRALSILGACREGPRVRLAILKLAEGDLDRLRDATNTAVTDYRDVLAAAEYPRYSREIGFNDVIESLQQTAIDEDWKQYQDWLQRK